MKNQFPINPGMFAGFIAGVILCAATLQAQTGSVEHGNSADYRIETIADGLNHPWSLAFLPDGRMLVTERAGNLHMIQNDELLASPVSGVPQAFASSQGGMLEVLVDPDFSDNNLIYLSYAHGDRDANATRIVRARLQEQSLADVEVLFTASPMKDTPVHYGGRMAWLGDGTLAIGLGDGFDYREQAQRLDNHFGKIVRIHRDGSIPADNPFVGQVDALDDIYSYGHRNIQGLVFDPATNTLWQHEHGPRGGDEVNRIRAGENYGWPVATQGIDYSGAIISPYESRPGMIDPEHVWTPSIAPSGMTLYRGAHFPQWDGDLLVTALVDRHVRRLDLENGQIVDEEILFAEINQRLRDIRTDPDGALYILTDANPGQILKITSASNTNDP
ncbi:MAG: PQQ-dependent sugar dehydrogenase [Pseudomonadota bacterium]